MNKSRSLAWLTAACSLALLAPLFGPLATGRVFVNTDLSWFHLPTRHLFQQALHSGDSVLWTPSLFAGLYIHGEGQVGLFHPLHQLLYRFLPLGAAFNLELVANYPAAFAGTFWFMRRLRFGHAAALFGAMLFAFSGFNLLHHQHINLVAVVAHMPWLLAAADVLIVDQRRRIRAIAFAVIAVVLGSELLIGFPQGVWWNAIAFAAFGVFRARETGRWRQLASCAGAAALGVLLGGIQLLPTIDAAVDSTRVKATADFALTYSLHPTDLIQLWAPYFFLGASGGPGTEHEYGLYSGAILTVALIWVWIRRPALTERRGLITAVTVFAGLSLILALGRYGGLGILLAHLPVYQSLRAPTRYIVLVQFALAILATVAFEDLLAIAERRRRAPSGFMMPLWIPAVLGVGMTIALNSHVLPYGRHTFSGLADAAAGVVFVLVVTLLIYLAGRQVRWALPALVVVTAVDLGMWGITYVYRDAAQTIEDLAASVPPAPNHLADSYAYVASDSLIPYFDVPIMRGYRLTSGYAGLFPATRRPLESAGFRRFSGTRWLFTSDGVRRPFEGAVDRVRLLDELREAATGSARLVVDRPGRLVAEVDAQGRRVLAFTERFHPGWSATVDGAPVPVVRVERDFLGCVVESGVHEVTLRFMPRSFIYGTVVSAVGTLLLAGVLIARLK